MTSVQPSRKTPRFADTQIEMAHGAGGTASRRLVEGLIGPYFANPALQAFGDAATLAVGSERIATTADGFVVRPLRFPGGSIGELAVNGTLNDLAVSGGQAHRFDGHLDSRGRTCRRACSRARSRRWRSPRARPAFRSSAAIPRSSNTARPTACTCRRSASACSTAARRSIRAAVRPGDQVLSVGPDRRPRHHDSAGARRSRPGSRLGLGYALRVAVRRSAARPRGRRLALDARPDARRGRHRAQRAGARRRLRRRALRGRVPMRAAVRGACELLGLDPLHIANEGQFLAVVAPGDARAALAAVRGDSGRRSRRR